MVDDTLMEEIRSAIGLAAACMCFTKPLYLDF